MSNFFIGSSNVYRNFDRAIASGLFSGRSLDLVRCTKKSVFDSHLASLTSANLILVSVLENFITDVCSGVQDDKVLFFSRQQITAHVDSLFALVNRLPSVNVIISPPLYRSNPIWFGSHLPEFQSFLAAEVAKTGSPRIGICASFVVLPSLLEPDGIHLTQAGGERFMSHLDAELQNMLVSAPAPGTSAVAEMDHSPSDDRLTQILDVVNKSATQLASISSLGISLDALSKTTSEFEYYARRRFRKDDYIFARLKEESDAELNRSREDRVVVTGLPAAPSSSHADKKKHYIDALTRLVALACASVDPLPLVVDVQINLRKDLHQPLV
jgi:hypothetical protein